MNYQEELRTALGFLKVFQEMHYPGVGESDVVTFLKRHASTKWGVFETLDIDGRGVGQPYILVKCYRETGEVVDKRIMVGPLVKWVD